MAINRCCAGIALALGVLASCATYKPQPISAAANARALNSRTLSDRRLLEFVDAGFALSGKTARSGEWDLDALTLAAVYYHPDLDIARARLGDARAGAIRAGQVPNPSADLGLSYNRTTTVPSPWTVGLMVNFIVETFGKRQTRQAYAEQLAEAARDDLASATWEVRGRVREALLQSWLAQHRRVLERERLDRQEALVRLIERRFELGDASALEVARERINRSQASLTLRDAERQATESRAQLAQSLGVPVRALEGLPLSAEAFDAPGTVPADATLAELRDVALRKRSDIQALLAEYAAAQSALQLQIASQFPNVVLGPGYTYDQGDHKYQLTVSAELPVFNQNQGAIAQAEARRVEVGARFMALQAQIIAAVDAAVGAYASSSQAVGTAEKLVADAQHRETVIRHRFDAGQADRPSLVGAQLELSAAELARLNALGAQRRAIGSLEDGLRVPLFGERMALPIQERNPRIAEKGVR